MNINTIAIAVDNKQPNIYDNVYVYAYAYAYVSQCFPINSMHFNVFFYIQFKCPPFKINKLYGFHFFALTLEM